MRPAPSGGTAPFYRRNLPFRPWPLFLWFTAANTLLSYFHLGTMTCLWVGCAGLLLPFLLAWSTYSPAPDAKDPVFRREFLPAVPGWVWWAFLAGAALIRFHRLTSLLVWPHGDEGYFSFFAISIMRNGVDRLFYMFSRVTPLYLWWLGLNFKFWGPSLANLWFWPAFFSALVPPLAYLAARQFSSRSFSFVCALVVGFSFWPWFIGRFSLQATLIPLAEAWALLWLGKHLYAPTFRGRLAAGLVLGLSLGLTFYGIFLHWFAVALVLLLTVAWKSRPLTLPTAVAGSFALAVSPFLGPAALAKVSSYTAPLWSAGTSFPFLSKLRVCFSYLQSVFWGLPLSYYSFQPVWGGFLNPVLDSLFILGLLEAIKNRRSPFYQWLIAALVLFFLPGFLSSDNETFRIVPLLAVLVPLIAAGAARLADGRSPGRSALVLSLLLLASLSLDLFHLEGPLHRVWDSPGYWVKYTKSIASYRAYRVLEPKSRSEGPGLVFSDLMPGIIDQTLPLASYSFNAAANPAIPFDSAKWAAVLVNVNYQPFLQERFKEGRTFWLFKDLSAYDGGWMLWVVPVTDGNRPVLRRWFDADRSLNGYIEASIEDFVPSGAPEGSRLLALQRTHPLFQDDRFLESCYWEKTADYYMKGHDFTRAVGALEKAVQKGYPAAHLYQKEGTLWSILGEPERSRESYNKAVHAPLDFTNTSSLLRNLPPAAPRPGKERP